MGVARRENCYLSSYPGEGVGELYFWLTGSGAANYLVSRGRAGNREQGIGSRE